MLVQYGVDALITQLRRHGPQVFAGADVDLALFDRILVAREGVEVQVAAEARAPQPEAQSISSRAIDRCTDPKISPSSAARRVCPSLSCIPKSLPRAPTIAMDWAGFSPAIRQCPTSSVSPRFLRPTSSASRSAAPVEGTYFEQLAAGTRRRPRERPPPRGSTLRCGRPGGW